MEEDVGIENVIFHGRIFRAEKNGKRHCRRARGGRLKVRTTASNYPTKIPQIFSGATGVSTINRWRQGEILETFHEAISPPAAPSAGSAATYRSTRGG